MPLFSKKNQTQKVTLQQLVDLLDLQGVSKKEMSEATYFACLKILGEGLGKLPLHVLHYSKESGVEKARNHFLYKKLAYAPNRYMTATHFWSTVENNRNQHGNSFAWITGAGSTTELWPLQSEKVRVIVDNKGLFDSGKTALWYAYNNEGETITIPYTSMLHFKTSTSFDGITGASVRDILKATVAGGNKSQQMLNKLYDNGFTAKAVLQYTGDLNDELTKKYMKGIEKYASGKDDTVKMLVPIPAGSQLTPISTKLVDNQFLELRKYSALQIAAAFGIKPNQINDYDKASYATAEQQQLAFLIDTMLYILKHYEEELNAKLIPGKDIDNGYYAKFNIASMLRADHSSQIQTLGTAVQNAIYTPNEARVFVDKPSMPGGDVLYCNSSLVPLKFAAAKTAEGSAA